MAFVPLNTNNSNLANYNSVNGLMLDYQGFKKAVNTSSAEGWVSGVLPSVSSVAYNGNRSYDITFAGPVTDYLSPGMRLKTVRQVAAPTYSAGALNGSSQYFVKSTPSGTLGTVTNNFTFMAWIYLTSYPTVSASIAARMDATATNGIFFRIEPTGQLAFGVINGGGSNYRLLTSAQSVPLNKWVQVSATWTSGTVTMYFDGVLVPMNTAITSGTAPTTAGTGGDFAIGRYGGFNGLYFPGYINGVGVFNAVLTQATIRSYLSQVLSGAETNCIGAWSLNNTANDQNAAANNLTAQGSAGFSLVSPYSTNGSGTATGTDDYAIVQAVSSTVATVSLPAGCTIPTSGGVAATYTSTQKNPFNWVTDKDRWEVLTRFRSLYSVIPPVINTWYNVGNLQLNVPKGVWDLRHVNNVYGSIGSANVIKLLTTLSTSTSAESDRRYTFDTEFGNLVAASGVTDHTETVNLTAATIYYGIIRCEATTLAGFYYLGDRADVSIRALPSGL